MNKIRQSPLHNPLRALNGRGCGKDILRGRVKGINGIPVFLSVFDFLLSSVMIFIGAALHPKQNDNHENYNRPNNTGQPFAIVDDITSFLQTYTGDYTPTSSLIYTLEHITASSFLMTLHLEGDTDKTHASTTKCKWLSDSQFTAVPAQKIVGNVTMIFSRKK